MSGGTRAFTPMSQGTHIQMDEYELKTSIEGLEVGMYVTRLDRPWIETPFPIQGLRIESQQDIETLGRYVTYVYVDTQKGPSPAHRYWVTGGAEGLALKNPDHPPIKVFNNTRDNEYTSLKKCFYEIRTSFVEEFHRAREIQAHLNTGLETLMTRLQRGETLDINQVREGVEAIVDSVVNNPSAFALLVQLEKSDEYTYSHALGTSVWCAQFGRHLGLDRGELNNLALGGMLLDIGKTRLPTALLNKPDALTPEESRVIQQHVDHGIRILVETRNIPHEVLRMVATHHERADGSGYPDGMQNADIPIYGRIAGIVDSYDAMTTKRPYSEVVYSAHEAINELYNCRGSCFQPELIEQFIQTVGLYPTGSLVEMETGEVGVVLEINDLKRLFPTVKLILDRDKTPLPEFESVDLSGADHDRFKIKTALPHGAYGIRMDQLFL